MLSKHYVNVGEVRHDTNPGSRRGEDVTNDFDGYLANTNVHGTIAYLQARNDLAELYALYSTFL